MIYSLPAISPPLPKSANRPRGLKSLIAEKAKETKGNRTDLGQKSGQGKTDKQLATIAGVSTEYPVEAHRMPLESFLSIQTVFYTLRA